MKKNYTLLFLFVLSTFLFGCTREITINKSDITKTTWTSVIDNSYCSDSLKFYMDNKVTYFSCEIGWDYDGFYKIYGDTIEISINTAQLEVDNYDPNNPTSIYLLKYKKNELEWLNIKNLTGNQVEEVEPEIYNQLNNWKK